MPRESLEERIATLERDLRTFAEIAFEAKHDSHNNRLDVEQLYEDTRGLGKDVALLDERVDGIETSRNLRTPAERLQHAIDLGASPEDVHLYFHSFAEALAKEGRSDELDAVVDAYVSYEIERGSVE